jgi:hypothetical protein
MVAEYSNQSGLYLAFNKSAQTDASARFPQTVACRTTHSLAFGGTPGALRGNRRKMADRLNANAVGQILELKDVSLGKLGFSARSQGYLILETLRRFAHSDSTELSLDHVPRYGPLALAPPDSVRPFRQSIHKCACRLWKKMCDPKDPTPLGHDGYLKRWALSDPSLDFDFILLDEAQDSNPAILSVLAKQKTQIVYVGDQYQQIYEWRGAVNAMQSIQTPNNTHLTESFRFGICIAEAASRILGALGETLTIRGNPSVDSQLGCVTPRAILCRTNAEVISRCLDALGLDLLPHIVGGTQELIRLLGGVSTLKRGLPCEIPDFFGFKNWGEVVAFSESPEGQHLKSLVRIVEQHGEQALISALEQTSDEETRAGIVVSTAHKAKGREWETVEVAEDFRIHRSKEKPDEPDEFDPAELRLLYVAMTRAKRAVQIPDLVASAFGISQTPRAATGLKQSLPLEPKEPPPHTFDS